MQAQGEFALVKAELEGALELAGQPVRRGTMAHRHIVYMMLAEAAGRLQDGEALHAYAARLEELADRDTHRPYQAIAHRAWGIAHKLDGQFGEAQHRLDLSLATFEELAFPWQAGRTLFEMGELALARDDAAAAQEYYTRAAAQFGQVGASPDLDRTHVALQVVRER